MSYEHIIVEREDAIATVMLNRPKVLNALNGPLMAELAEAMEALDEDPAVRCIVLTGNEKAFAAGADIQEFQNKDPIDLHLNNPFLTWTRVSRINKPVIAAVSGFALGGGCELALMCDMVIASETARFGLPETNLGLIPGAGGTQRLPRVVGKYLAMEMVLAGRMLTATEAQQAGIVNRVVPAEGYLDEAKALARTVAAKAPVALRLAKRAINKAFSSTLDEGLDFEQHCFFTLFASEDKKEGVDAFLAKRKAEFKGH